MNDQFVIKSKTYVYVLALSCVLGSFVFGYEMMCMGCLESYIVSYNKLTSSNKAIWFGVITSALPLGAFCGCFIVNLAIKTLGARKLMILLDIGTVMFSSLQMLDLSIFIQTFARFFLGIIIGINSAVIPKYLLSLAPPSMSGSIGSLNQLFITIGIAIAYAVGFGVKPNVSLSTTQIWRIVLYLPAFISILRILVFVFLIPYDLLERHYELSEIHMIQSYCDVVYVNVDAKTLIRINKLNKPNVSNDMEKRTVSYQRRNRLAIVVAISGQLSGINALLFYAKFILTEITSDEHKAQIDCFLLGIVQIVTTFIVGFFLDKFGKRTFMLVGLGMILAVLLSLFLCQNFDAPMQWSVAFIFIHIIGFSLSLGPIIWIYISEILNDHSFIIGTIWTLTFISAITTGVLIDTLKFRYLCLIYFVLEFLCAVYVFFNMKETKGLSPSKIQQLYNPGIPEAFDIQTEILQ